MNMSDQLIIKGTVIRHRLKKAEELFKKHFIEPTRKYLQENLTEETTIAGVAKPKLVYRAPQVNKKTVIEELKELVKSGKMTRNELGELLMNGSLTCGDSEQLAKAVGLKNNKDIEAYKTVVDSNGSLRWEGAYKGAVEDMAEAYTELGAIEDIIKDAAKRPLPDSTIEELKSKAAEPIF